MKQSKNSHFDPRIASVRQDPYPHYAYLRENHPVYFNPAIKKWMVTRNADVNRLLKDRRLSAQTATLRLPKSKLLSWLVKPIADTLPYTMIYSDPPRHTGLRQIASKFFTKSKIAELEKRVEEIAKETLNEIKNPDQFDLVADYSFPFTAKVIAELLGIPADKIPFLGKHSTRIAELVVSLSASPLQGIRAARSVASLIRFFGELIQEKRENPGGTDLISALANAPEVKLDDLEIINLSVLLVIAGHETTKNLIGIAIYSLLTRSGEYEKFVEKADNQDALETAVEEFLRYDSSVQAVFRVASEEIEVGDTRIPKNAPVLLMLGSANRDASAFENPDQLNLEREQNPQISFGGGAHFCLGAFLARLEGRLGLSVLLKRFPRLELVDAEQEWHLAITHRGLTRLRLRQPNSK